MHACVVNTPSPAAGAAVTRNLLLSPQVGAVWERRFGEDRDPADQELLLLQADANRHPLDDQHALRPLDRELVLDEREIPRREGRR